MAIDLAAILNGHKVSTALGLCNRICLGTRTPEWINYTITIFTSTILIQQSETENYTWIYCGCVEPFYGKLFNHCSVQYKIKWESPLYPTLITHITQNCVLFLLLVVFESANFSGQRNNTSFLWDENIFSGPNFCLISIDILGQHIFSIISHQNE